MHIKNYAGMEVLTFRGNKKKKILSGSSADVDYLSELNTRCIQFLSWCQVDTNSSARW